MSIDQVIKLAAVVVMSAIGIVGCTGLFYIGKKIKQLNQTLGWLQDDTAFMKGRQLDTRQCMNVMTDINRRLCDIVETVTVGSMLSESVGKDDVSDED